MKKVVAITLSVLFLTGSLMAESNRKFHDYEHLYSAVASNKDLNQIEDWENSLSNIWNFCVNTNHTEIDFSTVEELLKNPTELVYPSEEEVCKLFRYEGSYL